MPIGLQATLGGTVSASQTWGTISGTVAPLGPSTNTIRGTVSRDVVDAHEQPRGSGTLYYRIRLGGEWIPEAELAGSLSVEHDVDQHMSTWEFGLRGRRWSIFATEKTWTRTPVEVHRWRGQSASEMLADEPLVGYVLTCSQAHDPEPSVRVKCASAAVLYERSKICLEIPPYSGKRRGTIIREALATAGLTDVDVPPGAVYDKGLQAIDAPVFAWLREFCIPEGWAFRWRGETLVVYKPELIRDPLPPDATWTADQWESSSPAPPDRVPSVWLLRGTGAVVVDELGFETTTSETEVVAPYSPKVVVSRQLFGSTEVVQPVSLTPDPIQDRVVSRSVEQRVSRGNLLVSQQSDEWAYFNLGAAKLVSVPSADSFNYLDVYLDDGGKPVRWLKEKFVQVSSLRTTPTYDDDGNLVESRSESHGYYLRTIGIRPHSADPSIVTVNGAYVHGDGQSYSARYQTWGKFEEQVTRYLYDEGTGARNQEIQDHYEYYAPRVRIDGPPRTDWYVLYSGEAQSELHAQWRLKESRIKTDLVDSGDATVTGSSEVRFGYGEPPQKTDGKYDWGRFRSDQADSEAFGFLDRRTERIDQINDDQIEVETREPGKTPERRTHLGRRPLPAFRKSPWTVLRQTPLEVVIDDPLAEKWFGAEVRTMQSAHVLSTAEGLAVVERARRRALAPKVEITRPVTYVDVAGTVELVDPPSGMYGRALVTGLRENWDLAKAEFVATYRLEVERS